MTEPPKAVVCWTAPAQRHLRYLDADQSVCGKSTTPEPPSGRASQTDCRACWSVPHTLASWVEVDNVQPVWPDKPAAVWCTGGRGERRLTTYKLACATCGFFRRDGDHCFLFERCDRCDHPVNPCDPSRQLS